MPLALVIFHSLVQNYQGVGMPSEVGDQLVARAYFTLEVGGRRYDDMHIDILQPAGTDFETETIEARPPVGSYAGNWNHQAMKDAAEDYYRRTVGSAGSGIRIGGGNQGLVMVNNTFGREATYPLDIPD